MRGITTAFLIALAIPTSGQTTVYRNGWETPPVTAKETHYIVVVDVKEVVSGVSYLMNCSVERPDCNTIYSYNEKLVPFASKQAVQHYLENLPADFTFVKLFSLTDVPVTVKETVVPVPQPPVTKTTRTYVIKEPK